MWQVNETKKYKWKWKKKQKEQNKKLLHADSRLTAITFALVKKRRTKKRRDVKEREGPTMAGPTYIYC